MADNAQIRLIYALASKLGINQNSREDNLHQLVYTLTGKESIKELILNFHLSIEKAEKK